MALGILGRNDTESVVGTPLRMQSVLDTVRMEAIADRLPVKEREVAIPSVLVKHVCRLECDGASMWSTCLLSLNPLLAMHLGT